MKWTSKPTILLIAVAGILGTIWLVNSSANNATTKARKDFYADIKRNVADENNLLVAITGLGAPEGEDIIQYGRQRINTFYDTKDVKLRFALADKPQPNEIHIVELDEKDEVNCNHDDAIELLNGACITPNQLQAHTEKNRILLDRYLSLQTLSDWQGPQTNIDKELRVAHLTALLYAHNSWLLTQGEAEQAFELWQNNLAFVVKALGLEMDSGNQLSFMLAYRASLKALENLLVKAPDTIMAHHNEIKQLLLLNNLAKYNIKGMLRADYLWHDTYALGFENAEQIIDLEHLRNKTYLVHQDFLAFSKKPYQALAQARHALYDKHLHQNWLVSLINRYSKSNKKHNAEHLFRLATLGLYSLDLLNEMYEDMALTRSLEAAINIHQQQIKPHAVQAFLDQAGKAYHCPFTEKPMVYNTKKHTIWCENPANNNYETEVRLAAQ